MRQITKKDIEAARCAASYLDQDIEPSIDEACDSKEESGWGEAPSQTTCRKAESDAAERLIGWKAQARALWAKAYIAMESRQFAEMRNFAYSAEDAENKSDLLVAAIFGVKTPTPALVALGNQVSVEDAAAARAAVRKNIEAFKASRERKPTNAQAAFAARAEAERAAFEIGTIHTARNGRISFGKATRYFGWQTQRDYPQLFTSQEVKVRIKSCDPLSSGVEVEPA